MGHCGQVNQLPNEYFSAVNCGQSMHVRENPLFTVVRGLKRKLEDAEHVLGEVLLAMGS